MKSELKRLASEAFETEPIEGVAEAQAAAEEVIDIFNLRAETLGLKPISAAAEKKIRSRFSKIKKAGPRRKPRGRKRKSAKSLLVTRLRTQKKRTQSSIKLLKRKVTQINRDIRSLTGRKRRKTIISD